MVRNCPTSTSGRALVLWLTGRRASKAQLLFPPVRCPPRASKRQSARTGDIEACLQSSKRLATQLLSSLRRAVLSRWKVRTTFIVVNIACRDAPRMMIASSITRMKTPAVGRRFVREPAKCARLRFNWGRPDFMRRFPQASGRWE